MENIILRNNVRVIGSGDQAIILAHGFGCDQHVWRHLVKAFESFFKIVAFDYVGAGASDNSAYSSEKYGSLDGYAQDLIDVLDALEIRDVIFIGHSVSSMIGVRAAIKYPGHFSKLIFVAPTPSYINDGDYAGGMDKEDVESLLSIMEANYLGWSSSLAPLVMGNPESPELGDELTANFCSTNPDIAKEFARVTFLSDSRADLPKLKVESLTLQCSEDILAPIEVGEYIRTHTPNNSLVVLKATGHCPHLSAPKETVAAISKFLNCTYTDL